MNKLINKSELARQMELSRTAFENKLKLINKNKFSEAQEEKKKEILLSFANEIIEHYS